MDSNATPENGGSNDRLGVLPEPAAQASWWEQNGFDARKIDVLKEHAKLERGRWLVAPLYTAEQMRAYAETAVARDRCRTGWLNVNDPPCHPSDKDWRPCETCGMMRDAADVLERLQRELGECSGALNLVGHPIKWQARIDAAVAAERERCAQWLRDNYQAHPNIASLCDAMMSKPSCAPRPEN
jgi:hypothetical protein